MELSPQVTTEPSFLRAAKADSVEKISVTPLERDEKTKLESPPYGTISPSNDRAIIFNGGKG